MSIFATRFVLGGVSLFALLNAQAVLAQNPPASEGETDRNALEDIVVTAQKRTESVQAVPISISAVSSAELQAAATTDLDELTQNIVGITYDTTSAANPELYIRGIGTNRRDIGSDPSSAVYIDEIYQPRFSNILSGLVDIERVEILRGPQGTLFGRNTIGGAISATTADPSSYFEGRAQASGGNKDYYSVGGTVSGPLTDRIRARFSAGYSDIEGFMFDNVSGEDNGISNFTVRGKLSFDLTNNLEFKLAGSYARNKQGFASLHPGNLPLFLASPLITQSIDGDPYRGDYSIPGMNDIKHTQFDGRFMWKGNEATVTVIGSWIGFEQSASQDSDGTAFDIIEYRGTNNTDTYSAEVRVASTDGGFATFDDRLTWVAGLYYFNDAGSEVQEFTLGTDSLVSFLIANGAPPFTPPFNTPTVAKADTLNPSIDLTSIAAYAQFTYDITNKLSLTLGGRYTRDDRDYSYTSTNGLPGVPVPVVPMSFTVLGNVTNNSFDPKVGLQFKPMDDVLFYASYSQGYKSAAIQANATSPAIAGRVTDPESVDAYEIGLKSDFLDNRLRVNVAGFVNKFQDLQVRRVVTLPGGFATAIIENAASSTIKGIEVETSAILTPGLQINADYAYLDAKYDTYVVDAVAGIDFSGNQLVHAPKHRFNFEGVYTTDIGNAEFQVRAAYNHIGSFFFQPDNDAASKEDSYGLTSASARITLPNRTTSIQIWGRNLFNVEYRTLSFKLDREVTEGWSDKRTYGITLTQVF